MDKWLFEVVKLVVMGIALVIAKYLVPWFKNQIDVQRMQTATEWAKMAVLSAQQTLNESSGGDRKAAVIKFLKEFLATKGITVSDKQLDILIESAVKEMKMEELR